MAVMQLNAVTQQRLLDSDECVIVRNQLMELRDYWVPRSGGGFFTLGAAAYLDAVGQHSVYLEAAKGANAVLCRHFGWLLERVRQFFEESLGDAAFFDPRYAAPGFHIFGFNGVDYGRDDPAPRAHFDLQWMHAIPGHGPSETLSFTLLIEEPTGGASMAMWNARYQDAVTLRINAREYASQHPPQTIAYGRGFIVVHDGFTLHAIGNASVAAPMGYRITLQGHGVRLLQGWLLYW
jgi:hypothetical protein